MIVTRLTRGKAVRRCGPESEDSRGRINRGRKICLNHSLVYNAHVVFALEVLEDIGPVAILLGKCFQRIGDTCENSNKIQALQGKYIRLIQNLNKYLFQTGHQGE